MKQGNKKLGTFLVVLGACLLGMSTFPLLVAPPGYVYELHVGFWFKYSLPGPYVGQTVTIDAEAWLGDQPYEKPVSGGQITFYIDSTLIEVVPVVNDGGDRSRAAHEVYWTATSVGEHKVTVVYSGPDGEASASSAPDAFGSRASFITVVEPPDVVEPPEEPETNPAVSWLVRPTTVPAVLCLLAGALAFTRNKVNRK